MTNIETARRAVDLMASGKIPYCNLTQVRAQAIINGHTQRGLVKHIEEYVNGQLRRSHEGNGDTADQQASA